MTTIFLTGGVGSFAEIKPGGKAFENRPADRRPQLSIRVRALPLGALHNLLNGRYEL